MLQTRIACLLGVALLACSPCLVQAQPAGTARPVKPFRVDPRGITSDDAPSSYYVVFGGATVGSGVKGADPSTVNMAQMERTFKDIADLNLTVSGIVSLGGLVSNSVGDNGRTLAARLGLWRAFFETKTVSPLHCAIGAEALGSDGRVDPDAIESWRRFMTSKGWSNVDNVSAGMNFSYRQGKDRMVFLDTEREGGPNTAWLTDELSKDLADKAVERVFVFGSRPLVRPMDVKLDLKNQALVDGQSAKQARRALVGNPKVVAYFCGSPALFDVTPLDPNSTVKQVVSGNAGGPLEITEGGKKVPSYGFALIVGYSGGTVSVIPFSRTPPPNDQPFFSAKPNSPPAAVGAQEIILWSKRPGGSGQR